MLPIAYTGVRPGETLVAIPGYKPNSGSKIRIKHATLDREWSFPPNKSNVEELNHTDLRDKLSNIPYFAQIPNPEDRKTVLLRHAKDKKKLYMNDIPDLLVFFENLSGTFFTEKINEDLVQKLVEGNPDREDRYWAMSTVIELITGVTGESAPLIFGQYGWCVYYDTDPKEYEGIYINIDTGTINSGKIFKSENTILKIFEGLKLAITGERLHKFPDVFDIAQSIANVNSIPKELLTWMNKVPSVYKSLLQKLIRTRSKTSDGYSSDAMLLLCFCLLMIHPGSFVPDIQKFNTGLESATKRLAVSILEDSWTFDPTLIISLFAAALVSQNDRTYIPPVNTMHKWMVGAVSALKEPKMYEYDWHTFNKDFKYQPNYYTYAYYLLEELKSFQTDINMVGSIGINEGKPRQVANNEGWDSMPLIHCIDHHSMTYLAHYLTPTNEPYDVVFKDIWNLVTGINPRKGQVFEVNAKTNDIRNAQRLLWMKRSTEPIQLPIIPNKYETFTYEIDPSQLSGIIGPIHINLSGVGNIVVVPRCDDITSFTAVRKPSREDTEIKDLTPEEKELSIKKAKDILRKGISGKVPDSLHFLKGITINLIEDDYMITFPDKTVKNVYEAFKIVQKVPVLDVRSYSLENVILYTGEGVMEQALSHLEGYLKQLHIIVLRRLIMYLSGFHSEINMYKISRDGGSTEFAVTPIDTYVNHSLAGIANMFPIALLKTNEGYKVKNGPYLWWIKDIIGKHVGNRTAGIINNRISGVIDNRQLLDHQKDILDTMLKNHYAGKRGNLIWSSIGSGKTLCVIRYMLALGDKMQQYCVYTLPSASISSIIFEIETHKIPYQIVDPRAKSKIKTIKPGMINLIEHDHLRHDSIAPQLREHSGNMLFITDEFHKMLNNTKRTSIALEIIRLCADFVGLSGTLIKDNEVNNLIEWLEQIVEFEVTKDNYWVAVGALISKKFKTNVMVDRFPIDASSLLSEKYKEVVPASIGGTAQHINLKAALDYSYDATTKMMIQYIDRYIRSGEGVFVVAKNSKHQQYLKDVLRYLGVEIFLISHDNSITLTYNDPSPIKIVITTPRYDAGYTITKFRIMITSVYFSNQATRDQLEGRINRIGQQSPNVHIVTVHAGILSYIFEKYETARSLAAAMKGFADDINLNMTYQDIQKMMNE